MVSERTVGRGLSARRLPCRPMRPGNGTGALSPTIMLTQVRPNLPVLAPLLSPRMPASRPAPRRPIVGSSPGLFSLSVEPRQFSPPRRSQRRWADRRARSVRRLRGAQTGSRWARLRAAAVSCCCGRRDGRWRTAKPKPSPARGGSSRNPRSSGERQKPRGHRLQGAHDARANSARHPRQTSPGGAQHTGEFDQD